MANQNEIKENPKLDTSADREAFEEAIANMMTNPEMLDVSFYSFIIAKCRIHMIPSIKTAGVNFSGNSYNLAIGENFKEWTLLERIAVLVHESRHIISGHIFRQGEREHQLFNYASDIAMNQLIKNLPKGKKNPLTGKDEGGALYPETFKFPKNLTAEQYYELLLEEKKKQEKEKEEHDKKNPPKDCPDCGGTGKKDKPEGEDGDKEEGKGKGEESEDGKGEGEENSGGKGEGEEEGQGQGEGQDGEGDQEGEGQGQGQGEPEQEQCDTCGGSGTDSQWSPSNGNPDITNLDENLTIDNHAMWEKSDEDSEDLAKSVAEKMVKDSMSSTQRGHLPGDIENILDLLKRKPKISWKKELRMILSSKTGKKISTIKRRDRRFPHRRDLRGKKSTKDKHEIFVGVDTSGSMDDSQILEGLIEILEVAKLNGTDLKVIQIDTDIKSIEEFGEKKKQFKRRGYGGTYMGAIVPFLEEQKAKPDVLIMISDMYIEDIDTDKNWGNFKPKVLWLNTTPNGGGVETTRRNHKKINFADM